MAKIGVTIPKGTPTLGQRLKNAFVFGMIGGTAAKLGGGKFANGAVSGAFSRLFNDLKPEEIPDGAAACMDEDCYYKEIAKEPFGDPYYVQGHDEYDFVKVHPWGEGWKEVGHAFTLFYDKRIQAIGIGIENMEELKLGVFETKIKYQDYKVKYKYVFPRETPTYSEVRKFIEPRQKGKPIRVSDKPYKFDY